MMPVREGAIQTDVRRSRLSRLQKVVGPVCIPLTICTINAQRQHVLGICRTPPGAGTFQALLGDVSVGALNFS